MIRSAIVCLSSWFLRSLCLSLCCRLRAPLAHFMTVQAAAVSVGGVSAAAAGSSHIAPTTTSTTTAASRHWQQQQECSQPCGWTAAASASSREAPAATSRTPRADCGCEGRRLLITSTLSRCHFACCYIPCSRACVCLLCQRAVFADMRSLLTWQLPFVSQQLQWCALAMSVAQCSLVAIQHLSILLQIRTLNVC